MPAWAQGTAAKKRNVVIGHTGITWPARRLHRTTRRRTGSAAAPPDPALNETIFKDVSELGFAGLELFDWQINGLESQGLLGPFVEKYKLPLVASYTSVNLTDPSQRAATIAAAVNVGNIMKKHGGKTIVIGPSGRVGGASYNFNEHKQNIVTTLNELGKAITDIGLIAALHQHTGTAVETRDETYATMEAVDTRYVKFGPDIGQLQKGGVDPVAVVKHFLPVVQHMHVKDFVGGPSMAGYCALGLGKVDLVGCPRSDGRTRARRHDHGGAGQRRPDAIHGARSREDRTRLARRPGSADEGIAASHDDA